LAALIGLLAAASLPAQSLESTLARSRFQPEEKKAIEEQFQQAALQGIPLELLLPRLEEGIAKKAPPARVQEALRAQLVLLLQARDLLAGIPGAEVLLEDRASWVRTANLLDGPMKPPEVRELASACLKRPADYRQASSLYVSLVEWGLEPASAMQLVRALLASRFRGDSFPGVMEILLEGRRQRLAPEELVRRLLQNLPQATTLEELRRRTLR
jgi:hypothetical protein